MTVKSALRQLRVWAWVSGDSIYVEGSMVADMWFVSAGRVQGDGDRGATAATATGISRPASGAQNGTSTISQNGAAAADAGANGGGSESAETNGEGSSGAE